MATAKKTPTKKPAAKKPAAKKPAAKKPAAKEPAAKKPAAKKPAAKKPAAKKPAAKKPAAKKVVAAKAPVAVGKPLSRSTRKEVNHIQSLLKEVRGKRTRITILDPVGTRGGVGISRVGGPGFNLAEQPRYNDQPMTHL